MEIRGLICTNCGYSGNPKTKTKGSFFIELILWLFFIVPGLIYSIWRLTTKEKVCPACGKDSMLLANSPRGQEILKRYKMAKEQPEEPMLLEQDGPPGKKDRGRINWKAIIVFIGIPSAIIFLFVIIGSSNLDTTKQSFEKGYEEGKNVAQSGRVKNISTPTPTPDLTPIRKEISDKFCSSRKGEYVYGTFFCSGCANLEDINKFLESTGETITIRLASSPPKEDICNKVAENCLKVWDRETCTNLAEQNIWIGMTKNQLLVSWGGPKDKNNTVGSWGIHSQWVYADFGPYVYLEGKDEDSLKVTSWQD